MPRKKSPTSEMKPSKQAKTPLAQRINSLITDANALKDYLGCSIQAINQFRYGESRPSLENLCKIADYYHVSTDYLLGRTPDDVKTPDMEIRGACAFTGLSSTAVAFLHCADESRRQVLNDLIAHPSLLDTLNAYLHLNINAVAKWDEQERAKGAYRPTDQYERMVALADSKQGKVICIDSKNLDAVLLLQIEAEIQRMKLKQED